MVRAGTARRRARWLLAPALLVAELARLARAGCLIDGVSNASKPSPGLAMCAPYQQSACCDNGAELAFVVSLYATQYAAANVCMMKMLNLHCGVECHPYQDAFSASVENCTATDGGPWDCSTGVSLGSAGAAAQCAAAASGNCTHTPAGGTVKLCGSVCTALHASCAGVDNATLADPATWCESLSFPWAARGYNTTVVADAAAAGSCYGGLALDGCDGRPNSGVVKDRCLVCDGDNSTCTVPGAATQAAIRAELASNLSSVRTSTASVLTALNSTLELQKTRVQGEQARAASAHAANLSVTTAAREALEMSNAAHYDVIGNHTADVASRLGSATSEANDSLTTLAANVSQSHARVNADYARVGAQHTAQTAVSQAVLAGEMAAFQAENAEVGATLAGLLASP